MDTNSSELGGFSHQKRALLASLLDAELQTDTIGRRRNSGDYPLSAGQRRLWFLDRLEGGNHYNENLSVRVKGDLDHCIVERVFPVSYTHLDVYKRQPVYPARCSWISVADPHRSALILTRDSKRRGVIASGGASPQIK